MPTWLSELGTADHDGLAACHAALDGIVAVVEAIAGRNAGRRYLGHITRDEPMNGTPTERVPQELTRMIAELRGELVKRYYS